MEGNTRQQKDLTNGPAAAAILASGIGSLALGLSTTLAQAIAPVKEALNFYDPAGSLSGETTVAVEAESYGETTDGNVYNNEYHWLFEVRDGKIQGAREYMCTAHAVEVFGPLMAGAK